MAKVTMTPALGAAGGSMSNLSFVRQPDGSVSMRERKGGRQPGSKGQRAGQTACRRVVEAWQALDDEDRAAWEAYSELLHALGPTPSLSRPRAGYRVFSQLGLKALQATPGMAVPRLPPAAPFYGDGARMNCQSTNDGITFHCLVPNAPGVATELLVQPLLSPGRKGEADKYRSRGFVAFEAAGQTVEVPCGPGTALVAVRFVELASGQASGLVPLGRTVVGSAD